VKVDVPAELPPASGDELRIAEVLTNLLGNAIKFTDRGEVGVTVGVMGSEFLVSVWDTGPGIAPDDHARIFEEFHQVDGSSTREKGGTGLGLAIAERIVKLHGGRIWVQSSEGQGSSFWFTMPIRVERQAEDA
jgi:signal transduction histidine kinase